MKKTLIAIMAFGAVTFSNELSAQFESGSKFIGGAFEISSSGSKFKSGSISIEGNKTSSFTVMPTFGYFVGDNLAVGMGVGYTSSKTKDPEEKNDFSQSSVISFNPFARYYLVSEEKFGLFGQFSLPIGLGKEKQSYVTEEFVGFDPDTFESIFEEVAVVSEGNYTTVSPGISAGFTFLPTSNIALEGRLGLLSYSTTSAGDDDFKTTSSSFDFGLNLNSVSWSIVYFF